MTKQQDEISRMSKKELERALRACLEPSNSSAAGTKAQYHIGYNNGYQVGFERGRDQGWNDARLIWWNSMQRLNDEFDTYDSLVSYIFGVANAGVGQVPSVMLKDFSGLIAKAKDRIKSDVRRVEQNTELEIDIKPLEQEADALTDALKDMYSGKDENGKRLRQLASAFNPTLRKHATVDRVALQPGADRSDVINRLCERAKPYVEAGMTTDEILRQLADDTENNPDTADEYKKVINWSDAGFNKAYRKRYS